MELLKEIGIFFWAVINNWAAYSTGGIIVALIWLWSTAKQKTIPRPVGFGVAIFFLVCAFFNAWIVQYHDAEALREEIKKVNSERTPNFTGEIESISSAPSGTNNQDSIIFIFARVRNTGSPSVADHWNATVVLKSGKILELKDIVIPKHPVIFRMPSGMRMSLSFDDYLPIKAVNHPIPTGGECDGFFWGLAQGAAQQEVMDVGAIAKLNFSDVTGKAYELTIRMSGHKPDLIDYSTLQNKHLFKK